MGEPREESLPATAEPDRHPAAVGGVPAAGHQAAPLEPVDELHRAVVSQHEALGQLSQARPRPSRRAADGEEQLVLLGLEARRAGLALGEGQEAPDAVPELGQQLVLGVAQVHAMGDPGARSAEIYRETIRMGAPPLGPRAAGPARPVPVRPSPPPGRPASSHPSALP